MDRFRLAFVVLVLLGFTTAVSAQSLESCRPTEIGLSPSGLAKITELLQEEVRQGRIAGVVASVARHGRIGYLEAVGESTANVPMQQDALFRIASMTKAITSAAVMSLVEDGKLSLDDSLDKHLPEFSSLKLFVDGANNKEGHQTAIRSPTIAELLTHRSGFAYGWFGPEEFDSIYRDLQIPDLFVPINESMADRVDRLAQAPLKFKPGSAWEYSLSTDVLGRVVEVVSGLTLEQFFYERFFRPLKMHDTYFAVPNSKANRLAGLYTIDDEKNLVQVGTEPVTAGFLKFSADYCHAENRFFSGGGGLVASTTDYLRFLQMLLNGGELEGQRVLTRKTVELMVQNHIGQLSLPFEGHGDGFGYGFGVLTERGLAADVASVGTFSWGGIFNTYYWVDPQKKLVGVIMTQLFPYDHLTLRSDFKQLVYDAIDDSGFERTYWYEKGAENANPHFNGRQLRVNAPEVSVHPEFGSRSEPRSSGMARILIDEDLRSIRRADLVTEVWGGHPGTANKTLVVNGRRKLPIPEVGTESGNCTHHYPRFNLRPIDLVNGYNSLQFSCEQGDTFWGHYIVDNIGVRIGLNAEDSQLVESGLHEFSAEVGADETETGFAFQLQCEPKYASAIEAVHYQAHYSGYDENGNGWETDWHGMTKQQVPYAVVGTASDFPFRVEWDTQMLPAQEGVEIRAIVEFAESPLKYRTETTSGLKIAHNEATQVTLFRAENMPSPFWSRANKPKECVINIEVEPELIEAAELHVVAWTGGPGEVENYFTINGYHFPIADGSSHETVYSKLPIDPGLLKKGVNTVRLLSDTTHHGIEILLPGPAVMVKHAIAPEDVDSQNVTQAVRLDENAVDESAGGIECYRIETPNCTFFLDKVGAGLSSMVDRDGQDWLGFHPKPGSGAAGEYRGFPNAVFKEAGSYFHARNAGTDPCITIVEEVTSERVVISATSDNGLWAGTYTFTEDGCTFTMTKMPADRSFWVLYEGTPGGEYDDTDWWMTSAEIKKRSLTQNHEGDIDGDEWIAFGDVSSPRMLVLSNHQRDDHTDRYYQMQKKMTVFGFGREGMEKYLRTVPQSFSIGLVESTQHKEASNFAARVKKQAAEGQELRNSVSGRQVLEQFALRKGGDPAAGKQLFFDDERTKCATCHQVGDKGGSIGPALTKIGGKFDRPHLIESLLLPSAQIVEGYRTTLVVTVDDVAHAGIAKKETDAELELIDANSKLTVIPKKDIEQRKEAEVSLMPTGLADLLSPQEFTDLISYLETLRTGKASFGSGIAGPIELPDGFEITTIATGLSGATALEVASDGRVFVCEQDGRLRIIKDGKLLAEPFVTLPVEHNWERGLIGVTLDPGFPAEPYVYVVYVTDKPFTHHRVSRFRADGDKAVPGSEEILLKGDDQSKFGGNVPAGHQGGAIHFGNDGKLYIGIGEQTAKTPAQSFEALQGKILRINPDGSIPQDNPFLDRTQGKYQAIWAIGCRNPFTFAVHPVSGEILINDVGGKYEEINRGIPGANYGWPGIDHGPTQSEGITGPIHIYPQASISGGDFVPPRSAWPKEYRQAYLFADFVHGWIKTISKDNAEESAEFASGLRRPVDIRFAPDGSLYVLLRNAWVVDGKFEGGTGALMKISYRSQ